MTKIGRKCQKWLIRRVFDKPEAYGQSVTRQINSNRTKIGSMPELKNSSEIF